MKAKLYLLPLFCIGIFILLSTTGCRKAGHCAYLVCQNGGYCDGDTCVCKPGYVGALCENFSACDTINCLNGGACGNGRCYCPDGYEGPRCANAIRDKYLGTYKGTLTTNGTGIPNTTITVTAGTDSMSQVVLTVAQLGSMKATVSTGGGLNIPSQTNALGSISGSGGFSGNALNFSFSEVTILFTLDGSFSGTKQ